MEDGGVAVNGDGDSGVSDSKSDWPVAVPQSEWTPFQRCWMHAFEISNTRQNQQARLAGWTHRQRRTRQWIALGEIADWCARMPGSVARDEGHRAQAWHDLAQSIIAGEFNRRTKIGSGWLSVAFVPPWHFSCPEPIRFRLRASDLGNGALAHCWCRKIWLRGGFSPVGLICRPTLRCRWRKRPLFRSPTFRI